MGRGQEEKASDSVAYRACDHLKLPMSCSLKQPLLRPGLLGQCIKPSRPAGLQGWLSPFGEGGGTTSIQGRGRVGATTGPAEALRATGNSGYTQSSCYIETAYELRLSLIIWEMKHQKQYNKKQSFVGSLTLSLFGMRHSDEITSSISYLYRKLLICEHYY